MDFGKPLAAAETAIPGLVLFDLSVHGDDRGWFKENWQREKMTALGLPDFGPVQQNISFNTRAGTTRGIHAEPWDKWVSVASGRVFGAWVDLREGPGFGAVVTAELDSSRAVFVPRGVGNAFQTLVPGTSYTYLVNDHWSRESEYVFLNLADETAAIDWPIPLTDAVLSAADRTHPRMAQVQPVRPGKILVLGADGQLGRALRDHLGDQAEYASRADLDITDPGLPRSRRWQDYHAIINAAAYTAVDAAESPAGRLTAWQVNATAVARLAQVAATHRLTLVHFSTDYVFDGDATDPYREDAVPCPVSVYGQSKAAGELAAAAARQHYVLRTSWLIGEGRNFVATMAALAERGVDPRVVGDQVGRLTFAEDLASAAVYLLRRQAPFGTYHVTGGGPALSWADIARQVFRLSGHDPQRVTEVSTAEYSAGVGPLAPRPRHSMLDLAKITSTGFHPRDGEASLAQYLTRLRG